MRKTFVLSLVLLALAASTAAPGYSADMDPATETEVELPVEEPLVTPAEDAEIPELTELRQETREEKIRACEPSEAEHYCGPGCDCVITATNVYCFC